MILFRYITREILLTMFAITGILLLILLGGRFIRFFNAAAAGEIPVSIIGSLLLYRLPSFLELLLPLAFMLGVLLAYGRLYLDNEMTVLSACGVSDQGLLKLAFLPASLVALMVALASLWLTPWGLAQGEALLKEQAQRADFSVLNPGRFQDFSQNRVVYAEALTEGGSRMQGVFLHQAAEKTEQPPTVIRAQSGYQYIAPDTGSRYLIFEQGARYQGRPGQAEYQALTFDRYVVRISERPEAGETPKVNLLTTAELFALDQAEAIAQWQWRISMPLMVFVILLATVPLARTDARQGRFGRFLPAVLLHISYLSLLIALNSALAKGKIPPYPGLFAVHVGFLLLALGLNWRMFWRGKRWRVPFFASH